MSRVRMEWGWVKDYPIFVYMSFLDHNLWDVKVVKGTKGNQNTGNTSPTAPAWFKYTSKCNSRYEVCKEACKIAKNKLREKVEGSKMTQNIENTIPKKKKIYNYYKPKYHYELVAIFKTLYPNDPTTVHKKRTFSELYATYCDIMEKRIDKINA